MPTKRTIDWRNRIIDYGVKPARQFTLNPHNPRLHPDAQIQALRAALARLGWIAPVIENARTGHLIDGHERVLQAQAADATVPYVRVDLDPDEEQYALLTFDPITTMASYNASVLQDLLAKVEIEDARTRKLIGDLADRAELPAEAYLASDARSVLNRKDAHPLHEGKDVLLNWGDIMVPVDRVLYLRVLAFVDQPAHASRRAALETLLAHGLRAIDEATACSA